MSFIDTKWELWDGQALTASEESRTNGNIVDLEYVSASLALSHTDQQIGPLWLNILVSVAAGGMASGGYFQLVTSDSATFATGSGGEQVLAAIGSHNDPLFAANLAAGTRLSVGIPGMYTCMRYVEIEWLVVSESASGLTLDAWLGLAPIVNPVGIQKTPA